MKRLLSLASIAVAAFALSNCATAPATGCPPGCTKPCCATKAKCPPGCTKPCCAKKN